MGWPWATSGARKAGVPVIWPVWVSVTSPLACEMPKSVIFTRPSTGPPSPIRMLAGFTSRCTIPAAWVAASASATWAPTWRGLVLAQDAVLAEDLRQAAGRAGTP